MTAARNACRAPSRTVSRRTSNDINARVQSVQRTTADISDDLEGDQVTAAAMWIIKQLGTLARPIVEVQQRFGLNAVQACQACALAGEMRIPQKNGEENGAEWRATLGIRANSG